MKISFEILVPPDFSRKSKKNAGGPTLRRFTTACSGTLVYRTKDWDFGKVRIVNAKLVKRLINAKFFEGIETNAPDGYAINVVWGEVSFLNDLTKTGKKQKRVEAGGGSSEKTSPRILVSPGKVVGERGHLRENGAHQELRFGRGFCYNSSRYE